MWNIDWSSFRHSSLSFASFIWLKLQHLSLHEDCVVKLARMAVFSLVSSIWIGKTATHLSLTEMLAQFPELLPGTFPCGDLDKLFFIKHQ